LESGSHTDVIYTDFAKVSDTIPHKRLLSKLEANGLGRELIT